MIPTIIFSQENYFIVQHILTNGKTIEKSNILTGASEIIDHMYVYGDYCVCVTKNTDGTYSIWQSNDIGKNWTKVFDTASQITQIGRYDSGVVHVFLSNGNIYESTNSGNTFNLICASGPIAKRYVSGPLINGQFRMIVVHDGEKIWWSDDKSRSWFMCLDVRAMNSPTDLIYPAIAISGGHILAGAGRFVVYSPDFGDTWSSIYEFDVREYVYQLTAIGQDNGASFIAVTDYRGTDDVYKLYNTINRGLSWSPRFNSVNPLGSARGYNNKLTGSSEIIKMYTIGTQIIKRDLDVILHDNWKNASHVTYGSGYEEWINTEPILSNSMQLIDTTIITNDGIVWKYYNEYYNNYNYIDTISDLLEDVRTNVEPYL